MATHAPSGNDFESNSSGIRATTRRLHTSRSRHSSLEMPPLSTLAHGTDNVLPPEALDRQLVITDTARSIMSRSASPQPDTPALAGTPPFSVDTSREASPAATGSATPFEEGDGGAGNSDAGPSRRPNGNGDDDVELERFRREWQAEVSRRTARDDQRGQSAAAAAGVASSAATARGRQQSRFATVTSSGVHYHATDDDDAGDDQDEARPHSPSRTRHLLQLAEEQRRAAEEANGTRALPPRAVQHFNPEAPIDANPAHQAQTKSAVEAYARAVESERKGDLDAAVLHYRKAFRIDAAADRLYERAYAMMKQNTVGGVTGDRMEKHKDAMLASAEVAEMVRRANDFDDYRVEAIERAKVQQRNDPPAQRAAAAHALTPHGDDLDEIIARAAAATDVEGRDFQHLTFTSPPLLVSPDSQQDRGSADLAEQLGDVHLQEDGDKAKDQQQPASAPVKQPGPPPPIAKLPEEILAHICEMVIEPRGRRGAKVRLPKEVLAAQAAQTAQAGGRAGANARAARGKPGVKSNVAGVEQHTKLQPPASAPAETSTSATASNSSQAAAASSIPSPSRAAASLGVGVVLAGADWQSLEMLARTCWKWRVVTRNTAIWRRVLSETYYEPQLLLESPPRTIPNPRVTFVQHPRLRLTGCYIAACHYSRAGLSVDNVWVKVIHLVEFYRSIRFLPDGRVLTFLTTDQPKETVGKMHAANAEKGFAVGRWRVEWPDEDGGGADGESDDDDDDEVRRRQRRRHRSGARVILDDLRGKPTCAKK